MRQKQQYVCKLFDWLEMSNKNSYLMWDIVPGILRVWTGIINCTFSYITSAFIFLK